MIIDEKGKLFGKISVVDILVVLLIVAIGVFAWMKFSNDNTPTTLAEKDTLHVTLFVESINDFIIDAIEVGSIARDPSKNVSFGKVIRVDDAEAIVYNPNSEGETVASNKPGYKSAEIVVECQGVIGKNAILIDGTEYLVGKSFEARLGKSSAVWTRISKIEKAEE